MDGSCLGVLMAPVAIPEWGGQFFGRGFIHRTTQDEDGRPNIVKLRIRRDG